MIQPLGKRTTPCIGNAPQPNQVGPFNRIVSDDVSLKIFSLLEPMQLAKTALVCRRWTTLSKKGYHQIQSSLWSDLIEFFVTKLNLTSDHEISKLRWTFDESSPSFWRVHHQLVLNRSRLADLLSKLSEEALVDLEPQLELVRHPPQCTTLCTLASLYKQIEPRDDRLRGVSQALFEQRDFDKALEVAKAIHDPDAQNLALKALAQKALDDGDLHVGCEMMRGLHPTQKIDLIRQVIRIFLLSGEPVAAVFIAKQLPNPEDQIEEIWNCIELVRRAGKSEIARSIGEREIFPRLPKRRALFNEDEAKLQTCLSNPTMALEHIQRDLKGNKKTDALCHVINALTLKNQFCKAISLVKSLESPFLRDSLYDAMARVFFIRGQYQEAFLVLKSISDERRQTLGADFLSSLLHMGEFKRVVELLNAQRNNLMSYSDRFQQHVANRLLFTGNVSTLREVSSHILFDSVRAAQGANLAIQELSLGMRSLNLDDQSSPQSQSDLLAQMSSMCLKAGDLKGAREHAVKALRLFDNPFTNDLFVPIVLMHLQKDDIEGALLCEKAYQEQRPKKRVLLLTKIAHALFSQEDPDRIVQAFSVVAGSPIPLSLKEKLIRSFFKERRYQEAIHDELVPRFFQALSEEASSLPHEASRLCMIVAEHLAERGKFELLRDGIRLIQRKDIQSLLLDELTLLMVNKQRLEAFEVAALFRTRDERKESFHLISHLFSSQGPFTLPRNLGEIISEIELALSDEEEREEILENMARLILWKILHGPEIDEERIDMVLFAMRKVHNVEVRSNLLKQLVHALVLQSKLPWARRVAEAIPQENVRAPLLQELETI